ncbi:alpha/beta fold hydrolase [Nocardia sp. NPDC050793]|uniref:thioesterase II family protein n=1 Tax=Nocardia sp. NPDC050793 TaxID=3155159 RepID=UPI0034029133
MKLMMENRAFWRARRPDARNRLICFPHAGAGASAFSEWAQLLPDDIELAAVQLPGRQNRIAEDPAVDVAQLVESLVSELSPILDGRFAFFGHSCGAVLAFETACALRDRGLPTADHLFLSAQPEPGMRDSVRRLHDLSDAELAAEMVRLGGLDPEVAANEAVMSILLPSVRADFTLWELHRPEPGAKLTCPITVLTGESDPRTPLHTVGGWREYTSGEFDIRLFPGGHFYFQSSGSDVVRLIGDTLLARN